MLASCRPPAVMSNSTYFFGASPNI